MRNIFKKTEMIHFSGRKHSKLGIFSAVIGIAVILGFLTVSIISGAMKGKGGELLGIIGLLLFALAVSGFVLSYKALKQRDIFYRFPLIGAVLNGFMTILFVIIYILGFAG